MLQDELIKDNTERYAIKLLEERYQEEYRGSREEKILRKYKNVGSNLENIIIDLTANLI